jgi:hypothetical protein
VEWRAAELYCLSSAVTAGLVKHAAGKRPMSIGVPFLFLFRPLIRP